MKDQVNGKSHQAQLTKRPGHTERKHHCQHTSSDQQWPSHITLTTWQRASHREKTSLPTHIIRSTVTNSRHTHHLTTCFSQRENIVANTHHQINSDQVTSHSPPDNMLHTERKHHCQHTSSDQQWPSHVTLTTWQHASHTVRKHHCQHTSSEQQWPSHVTLTTWKHASHREKTSLPTHIIRSTVTKSRHTHHLTTCFTERKHHCQHTSSLQHTSSDQQWPSHVTLTTSENISTNCRCLMSYYSWQRRQRCRLPRSGPRLRRWATVTTNDGTNCYLLRTECESCMWQVCECSVQGSSLSVTYNTLPSVSHNS